MSGGRDNVLFCDLRVGIGESLLDWKFYVKDCGKEGSLGGDGRSVMLGAEGTEERWLGIDEAAVLRFHGVLVRPFGSAVRAASKCVKIGIELAYFFRQ